MRFEKAMLTEKSNESAMNDSIMKLWIKLVDNDKVPADDEGLFYAFKSFYHSFLNKHHKRPLLKDAFAFVRTNT
jgi:hypothetical protein